MATYYVSTTTGNNANAGTSAALPWATLAFALGAASGTNPGLVGGDIVYVAPGNYNEAVTLGMTSASSTVQILGDPLNLQGFPTVTPGNVYWYNSSGACLTATSKNNITFKNIYFERLNSSLVGLSLTTCYGWTFQLCVFGTPVSLTVAQSTALNLTVDRCIWPNTYISNRAITIIGASGANYDISTVIKDCLVVGQAGILNMSGNIGGVAVTNCTILTYDQAIRNTSTNTTHKLTVKNCLIVSTTAIFAGTSGTTVGDFNHRIQGGVSNVAETNTITTEQLGFDAGYARLTGVGLNDFYGSYLTSPNLGTGTATGAPTTDLYGVTWLANPDIGAVQRSASLNFQPQFNPGERNASTITIAPGSTSQSIELYLGITGLTASTSNLTARYNRTRTASVSIPLVARTIAQAWTAGGFAEVDATNMPGVYRLDVPDAALAAGADDVTVVVRGASGTNGAVMTIKLSSGGLTEAQTAGAVWGASVAGYIAETDFGGVVNATRNVVGGIETSVQDIPQTVWDEPKANHTIPNTFGDYLDTKVSTGADTSRIQLRQGPFLIKQNATEGLITEVNQFLSTVPNMEMVLIDSSGGAVSVAGSTLVLRVRNQAGTAVVNNVTPTVAYADGGVIRWTPNLSWNALSVTTPGTYRIIVERTMGTTTTTFGPFLVQLSSG
jgi:hypothetical protein